MIAADDQEMVEGKSDVVALWKMAGRSRAQLEGDGTAEIGCTVNPIEVCLLTGGDDRPYALGMASTLASMAIRVDFIGSNKLDAPELHSTPRIAFLNLRGDQSEDAPFRRKFVRILTYYARLLKYVLRSRPRIFHVLWNNKFEHFDRTLLMLYYRLFGKRIVFTAHNVNTRKRDGRDSWLNRLTLGIQYRLCHHMLVHTPAMKDELITDFRIPPQRVTVIPFGINNTCPSTGLGHQDARKLVGLRPTDKVLLFFGQIAPYKGLEYLVSAFGELVKQDSDYRLLIAGKVKKGYSGYWNEIQGRIRASEIHSRVVLRIEHIPDKEVESYFKAADVVVIPYAEIFQSGVPFLSYSFGLPVIATDVGSLRDDIVEGETGFLCQPKDPVDLAETIKTYFASDLYQDLAGRRRRIQAFANDRYSWSRVGEILDGVYRHVLGKTYHADHLSLR